MKIYFAHPVNSYDQPVEQLCLDAISDHFGAGVEVVNPNSPEHDAAYAAANVVPGGGMAYFTRDVVPACDALCFLAFEEDGRISSGCVLEIDRARQLGHPIFEVVVEEVGAGERSAYVALPDVGLLDERALPREDTKARVRFPDGAPRAWTW